MARHLCASAVGVVLAARRREALCALSSLICELMSDLRFDQYLQSFHFLNDDGCMATDDAIDARNFRRRVFARGAARQPPANRLQCTYSSKVGTEVRHDAVSSIERMYDDHMVSLEVCDAQEPAGSTFCGREIDPTASPTTRTRVVCITVIPLRRLSTTSVRRSDGCLRTARYVPRCVMLKSRPDRRFVVARSI